MNYTQGSISKLMLAVLLTVTVVAGYLVVTQPDSHSSSIGTVSDNQLNNQLNNQLDKQQANNSDDMLYPVSEQKKDIVDRTSSPPLILSSLALIGVVVVNPVENSTAIIRSSDTNANYSIGDVIENSSAILTQVFTSYVTVTIEGIEYKLLLTGGLKTNDLNIANTHSSVTNNYNEMTVKEIGNRPKTIEHIVEINPQDNNYSVSTGINPALFRAAKFKEGDELQTINGKDVSNPEELAEANALIATAQTLVFTVLRGGKLLTLYLDIPSENLQFTDD